MTASRKSTPASRRTAAARPKEQTTANGAAGPVQPGRSVGVVARDLNRPWTGETSGRRAAREPRHRKKCHQQQVGYMTMSIPKEPTHCSRCQGALADTVIIVAQIVPRHHKRPRERDSTLLLHVCEQCATPGELNGAKTQVICPGCSRKLLIPYQWN